MRKTIYWSVTNDGHTYYYFDKKQMLADWGNAKHLLKNIEKYDIRFYSLDTEITDEMILDLLNGKFSHCVFPNYRSARLINIEKESYIGY